MTRKDTPLTEPLMQGTSEAEEIEIEERAVRLGVERYYMDRDNAIKRGTVAMLKPVEQMVIRWLGPLTDLIAKEQVHIDKGKPGAHRGTYGPVLMLLDPSQVAAITLIETMNYCVTAPEGARLPSLSVAIGQAILGEANAELIRANDKDRRAALKRDRDTMDPEQYRELRREAMNMSYQALQQRVRGFVRPRKANWWAKRHLDAHRVELSASAQAGAFCLAGLVAVADIETRDKDGNTIIVAGLMTLKWSNDGRKIRGYVKLTHEAWDIINTADRHRSVLHPRYPPMIVQPYPWTESEPGGYVKIRTPLITQIRPIHKKVMANADLTTPRRALNIINAKPWRINRRVLDVAETLWKIGGNVAGLPPKEQSTKPVKLEEGTPEDIKRNRSEYARWNHLERRVYPAERQITMRRLMIARENATRRHIYFPHQFDFRSRMYAIPQPLNHQGPDLCRGLLECGYGVPVSEVGQRWLRIHAANSFGVDKVPLDARVAWTEANMSRIAAAADDPIGTEWWRQADNPWQFIAACFALTDPEAAAHLPVQIDGSCNGLQHYAAMGRSSTEAANVNLMPSSAPSDVYAAVANYLLPRVKRDAEEGSESAALVLPLLSRKTTKRTVMTKVYGITIVGAQEHLREALEDAGMNDQQAKTVARYLAKPMMNAVNEVCPKAAEIMGWIQTVARMVSNQTNQPLTWRTPAGWPVAQAYYNDKPWLIHTLLGSFTMVSSDVGKDVSHKFQVSGAAPNFVHGVDAAHMMMTTIRCDQAWFAGVHDCYWSHAESMPDVARFTREEFVSLHQRPILENFRTDLSRSTGIELPEPPARGDFDLKEVLDSDYFFS